MSREIKFRAWDRDQGRYRHGNADNLFMSLGGMLWWQFSIDPPMPIDSERFIIEQFTGLLDKDGKEIFEGDVVEYAYKSIGAGRLSWIRPVVIRTDGVQMGGRQIEQNPTMTMHRDETTVIGNIHEHPHLTDTPEQGVSE